MVAAKQFKERFAAYLQPPPPGSSLPPTQPDGSPWPIQVGVACSSGLEFTTHSVRAVLDENPGWVDIALDAKNAFNSIHRRAYLKVIGEHFPGLWNWAWSNYGHPTELYVRRDNLTPEVIQSRSGTRQGDPLGAQYFALGLHPTLCLVSSLLGQRGQLIAYADDVHILCPPSVAAEILPLLASPDPISPLDSPDFDDCSFISIGLELGPGKQSIYGPSLSDPATRKRVTGILRPAIELLGDPRLATLQEKADALLRGDGSTVAAGHPVLGSPVGTDAYVEAVVLASATRAMNLIPILDRLLLQKDPAKSGAFAPDERDLLIRLCIAPRLRHLLRTVRPGLCTDTFRTFDSRIREARFLPIDTIQSPNFTPVHIDHHRLSSLAGRFGGHGTLLHVNIDPNDQSASNHDVAYYGSMAAVWHYIRTWVFPLKDRNLAHRAAGCGAYQHHIHHAFTRIMTSFTQVGLHPDQDLLPINSHFPQLHSRLDDGRLSPATVPLGVEPRAKILTTPSTHPRFSTISIALTLLATHTRIAQPRQW